MCRWTLRRPRGPQTPGPHTFVYSPPWEGGTPLGRSYQKGCLLEKMKKARATDLASASSHTESGTHGSVLGFHNSSLGFPAMDLLVSSSLHLSLMPCSSQFYCSSVLKVDCTMESSGRLVRTQIPGPLPRVSDSPGLG